MRKLILAITTLVFFSATNAQTVNDTKIEDIDVNYMLLVGTSKLFSNKVTVEVDFGQKVPFFNSGKQTIVKDTDGKAVNFNSMIDALNFFTKYGFEFVNAYSVTVSNQNVYHWLLKKKDSNDKK